MDQETKARITPLLTPEHYRKFEELKEFWRFNNSRATEEMIDIAYAAVIGKPRGQG